MKTFLKMNLPNKLTTLRMFAVLIVVAIALIPWNGVPHFTGSAIKDWMYATTFNANIIWIRVTLCVLFIIASLTDMLDGKIARSRGLVTTYGKFMDPIADKLLVNSMFIILTFWGLVPVGVLLIVICRDIVVDAIRMIMCEKNVVIPANIFGKLKTVIQMIAIPLVLLYSLIFKNIATTFPLDLIFCYFAAIASLVSGIIYFYQAKDVLLEGVND